MVLQDPIVIVGAARTPIGGFQGELKEATAPELGATAIRAALQRSRIAAEAIEEVVFGCVLPAGQGQAPARQAAIHAGLPFATAASTVNKMCGSGMKAVMMAHDLIAAGSASVAIAGGMESMTNAPYLLDKARGGYRLGHGRVVDHMFLDGLEDAYDKGRLMGSFAEDCAEAYQFTREAQDNYAIASLTRAQKAIAEGCFESEIVPVTVKSGKAEQVASRDEQPGKAKLDKIPTLKPAFREGGTVTAANSSSISDGAAALVLMRRSEAEHRGLKPLATILGHATHSQAPNLFATAPIGALQKLSDRTGLPLSEVDLFEINEAFAVVAMAAMRDLNLPHEKVNVHGGACALGHPIGASGARILVTLLAALERYDLKRGMAALCIGGGEATAVAIERQ
ncbi:acetyl-CoA C-acyltransferase [Rhizobium leguminosarum]|jgi:acetyl-CoA C-acetyltransferase|uniref:Beta-ketothiolase n=1 Tax=Rhizobium leguminosarum TaxID=384 RepID=A0A6P0DCS9_RHILE|nr:acetyl-CoA C-acyltransferase [Rhizobium leguminosarum]ASS59784.1 acetyl-CoA acetyltransferase [Rhizobium leguminosarum bv. viciae]AVC46031.1 acetyl-CoA C-acetyltransferase family protein [Rhizobium leguminosarum bv. viciae]MBB4330951.1 acetyl-CoA C-acetyltransferase [Rhizobium leguminosarum]MBB4340451.1 acetyl-CoA C-acetyltransferase [Rhizobium leguminosarum]MBB4356138.1 acetyl-CoA C-acetyltransferase [Rhizobium leguminosarum]